MNDSAKWLRLSPTDFEELVFWILQREGFFNVRWYGESGSDKGRDVICQRTELLGPRVLVHDCVVQCKRYSGRVARQRIYQDILKASEHNPDYFILATTGIVSASTKDWLDSHLEKLGVRVVLWERTDLSILLERHQDLAAKFLEIPVEPDYFLQHLARESSILSTVDKLLLKPMVREAITDACQMAVNSSSAVALGHLLIPLLLKDEQCTRPLYLSQEIDPDMLADCIHFVVRTLPKVQMMRFGLQPTQSLRLALEIAVRVMGILGESVLSERVLLWAALLQRHSGTIQTLEEVHHISVRRVIPALEQRFFEQHEVVSVLKKQQMRAELTLRTDPIESLRLPTEEEWRKISGREKIAPRAHLPIVRCYLEGHLERRPSDVELCAWIRFCYNRDFYAEVVALFPHIDENRVDAEEIRQVREMTEVCRLKMNEWNASQRLQL